ncbi:hypothetical protein ACFRFH_14400 [Leifsonia sp. NPDC056824]|uniref:hypothetical protein n=1 Tax=Leifsonia sp. NPDC056824 TaxID=3345953 RepID=UPI003678466F
MNEHRYYTARVHRFDGTVEMIQFPLVDGKPDEWLDYTHHDGVHRRYLLAPERAEIDIYEYVLEQSGA